MSDEFVITCAAEAAESRFVPTVRITRNERDVFSWRCAIAFSEQSKALVYARDYGEVALEALKRRG